MSAGQVGRVVEMVLVGLATTVVSGLLVMANGETVLRWLHDNPQLALRSGHADVVAAVSLGAFLGVISTLVLFAYVAYEAGTHAAWTALAMFLGTFTGVVGGMVDYAEGASITRWWDQAALPQITGAYHRLVGENDSSSPSRPPRPNLRTAPATTPPATTPPATKPAAIAPPASSAAPAPSSPYGDAVARGRVSGKPASGSPLRILLHAGEVLRVESGQYEAVGPTRWTECPSASGRNCLLFWGATADQLLVVRDYVPGHIVLAISRGAAADVFWSECPAANGFAPFCTPMHGAVTALIAIIRDGCLVSDPRIPYDPFELGPA